MIYYREPTYDLRRGCEPRVFKEVFIVAAPSASNAAAASRRYFDHMALVSQVSWVREIDRIEAELECTRLLDQHGVFIGRLH